MQSPLKECCPSLIDEPHLETCLLGDGFVDVDLEAVEMDEPHDRLTQLCAKMRETLRAQPDTDDVRMIVFISDAEKSGIVADGYEDVTEAIAELFLHMKAIFQARGGDLGFIGIPDSPEDL